MPPGLVHRAVDALAVWAEDRVRRAAEPLVLAAPEPLDCFGPLPPLPPAPEAGSGRWAMASPRPAHAGDAVRVDVTPARGPRRGIALLVPPWKIRRRGLVAGYVQGIASAGWDAWLLTPPHHLERTAAGQRSGEGFVSLDLARLRAAVEQSVLELRAAAALAGRAGPVALVGLSLGALAAALAATGPEPLDRVVLVAPPRLDLVLAGTGIGRRYRRLAQRGGAPWPAPEALAAALRPFDPAARRPATGRVLVAAGEHDAIAPPGGARVLAAAWGVAPAVYPRGHLTLLFGSRALRRDLDRFLRAP